jgi:hypothetical protein
MTPSELKARIQSNNEESHFFDHKTMRFFGDSMRNFGVRGPLTMKTHSGELVQVYELYRRRAVKNGNRSSFYFNAETFARTFGELQS